jgi:hypothetical protein
MSIEKTLADLTVALNENTAALKALASTGGASAPAAAPAAGKSAGKPAAAAKPTHTRAEMNAVLQEVKEKKGAPAAKAIIKETGGVEKMAEIPDDKIDAVYDAAKKAVPADDDGDM